jgi:hypothetical protein
VWLSDIPDAECIPVLFEVEIELSEEELSQYEHKWESGLHYREWLVPATILNAKSKIKEITETPQDLLRAMYELRREMQEERRELDAETRAMLDKDDLFIEQLIRKVLSGEMSAEEGEVLKENIRRVWKV